MPTIQIADKPTLDSVNTTTSSTATTVGTISTNIATAKADTTVLKTRGGIKSDGTDLYGYNPTTSAWDKVSVGGGGGSTLVIKNENGSLTGKDVTITHESGLFTRTITGTSDSYYRVEVPYTGKYMIRSDIKAASIEVVGSGDTVVVMSILIPAFSTASWAEIGSVCEAYYNGEIADLSQYWSIGDTKSIDIAAMSATGVGESHEAQTKNIAIIDFDHNNLTTAINNKTKAAITLQLVDCLNNTGYIKSPASNINGWENCPRRTWCNEIFYNALPNDLKIIIKSVDNKTGRGNTSTSLYTSSDKCWFPSEIEVRGTNSYSVSGEGAQYPYYTTTSNKIKIAGTSQTYWWTRSPRTSTTYVYVAISGNAYNGFSSANNYGLSPAFCI